MSTLTQTLTKKETKLGQDRAEEAAPTKLDDQHNTLAMPVRAHNVAAAQSPRPRHEPGTALPTVAASAARPACAASQTKAAISKRLAKRLVPLDVVRSATARASPAPHAAPLQPLAPQRRARDRLRRQSHHALDLPLALPSSRRPPARLVGPSWKASARLTSGASKHGSRRGGRAVSLAPLRCRRARRSIHLSSACFVAAPRSAPLVLAPFDIARGRLLLGRASGRSRAW